MYEKEYRWYKMNNISISSLFKLNINTVSLIITEGLSIYRVNDRYGFILCKIDIKHFYSISPFEFFSQCS